MQQLRSLNLLREISISSTTIGPPGIRLREFPEGANIHTIVQGDTLWDLAGEFFGDPYLWPQLWEQNQYIEDAHWIYPGDPLVVSVEVVPVEHLGAVDLDSDATGENRRSDERLQLGSGANAPQPLGTEDDIYCSGYIGSLDEEFGYHLTGSEYQALSPAVDGSASRETGEGLYGSVDTVKVDLTFGDIVYVDGGRAGGLSAGLVFTVLRRGEPVVSSVDGEVAGRLFTYQGRVRILSVQDESAIAEVVSACDVVLVGDALTPFVPEPVPLGRRVGSIPSQRSSRDRPATRRGADSCDQGQYGKSRTRSRRLHRSGGRGWRGAWRHLYDLSTKPRWFSAHRSWGASCTFGP